MSSPGEVNRKRKLAFDTPAKEIRRTHSWITKAGDAYIFFVELAGADIANMEHVLGAMNTAALRGKAKISNKNPNVAQTLTASDVNTAKLNAAVLSIVSACPIKSDDLNFFAKKNATPSVTVRREDGYVEVMGNLYMLEPFLLDPEGFNAAVVEPYRKYKINMAEDFTAEDIGAAVKQMADKWGFKFTGGHCIA